jgi:hypothetical protein
MAIEQVINEKGVKLEEAYIKLNFVNFAVDIFANLEARQNGVLFDHKTISIQPNSKLYEVLKEEVFKDSIDIDNSWKEEKDEEVII